MAKVRVLSCVLVSFAFTGIAFLGCSDSGQGIYPQTEEQTQNDTEVNILTSVFPSPKEQNPYSVENMNKTFKNLVLANNPNAEDIDYSLAELWQSSSLAIALCSGVMV